MSKVNTNIFDDDWELPDEEEEQTIHILNTDKPFQVQYKKYMEWYSEFIATSERYQTEVFQTGVGFTNHPLIEVTQVNYEKNVGLFDIIRIQSKSTQIFQRTALLFTFLDNEVSKIKEQLESGPLDSLLLYGQRAKDVQLAEGEAQLQIGRSLGLFKQLYFLIKKLMSYVEHSILQLHCIMNKKDPHFKTLFKSNLSMQLLVKLIGRALKLIYVIDCLVNNNQYLLDHWKLYKVLIRVMKTEPEKFGITLAQAKSLEKFATKLDGSLLSGKCFRIVLQMPYDKFFQTAKSDLGSIKNNKDLKQFLETFLTQNLKKVSQVIGTQKDKQQRQFLLQILCVYAFFRRLYPSQDLRDLWKDAWSILRKVPILEGYGSTSVQIWTFLQQECPLIRPSKSKDPKDINAYLQLFITKIDQNSQSDINALYTLLCVWLSRMQSLTTSNLTFSQPSSKQSVQAIFSDRIILLLHGLSLASQLRNTIYTLFSVHVSVGAAFSKDLVSIILLGLQSLKAIELIFKQKAEAFDITLINKLIGRDLYKIIKFSLDKVTSEDIKKKPQRAQAYSSLKKVKQLLSSPITGLKLSVIKYSLAFSCGILLSQQSYQQATKQIRKLEQASQWHLIVRQLTNCSFLYGSRQILPFFFESKRNNPGSCKRLQLMFNSFQDSGIMLQRPVHLLNTQQLFLDYKQYVLDEFEQKYMIPLKRLLEDFLRINTHFMLLQKIQGQNPFKTETKDLLKLVHLQKLRIFDSLIDIKSQITKSLNENFYNINALNMHDMETYQQIRNMGNYLFGLELQDAFLPSQTIQQGKFDIMTVLKNIPQFVQKYKYNIFTQTFLEVTTEAKQISSIGIKQLSDSIKTHGLGIMATTVNAFYKFLAKKINLFNKFLYDELISSPLTRQKNYLKSEMQKDDFSGYYPYLRAQGFYKQIKKLGKTQDDLTFMDKFRQLITSVGNVLGFVRLLRSASLRYSSKNVEFLPTKMDMQDEKLSDIAGRTNLSAPSIKTCGQLDEIFKSLEESFSERADYLNILVKGFSKIASKQNKHLKLFYLLVPALTVNYIENMLIGKEQINKKLSMKAFINDDGLLLGVAYFLALLRQQDHYQALHWDLAIQAHFQSQIKQNKQFTRRADKSQKVNNDLNVQRQMSLRKLTNQYEQFQMMDYTLSAAKVLFRPQQTPPDNPPPAQKPAESQPPPAES